MKRIYGLLAVAVLGLASCTNDATEDLVTVPGSGEGKTTLTATIADAAVRTELGEKTAEGKYPLYWSAGDVVSVNGEAVEVAIREDATLADLETSASAPYRVVYPYVEGMNPAHVRFADMQAYTAGTFAPASAPMYGYSENAAISMNHLSGVLRFSITAAEALTLNNIVVTAEQAISGDFALDFRTGEIAAVEGASSNTMTYTFAEGEGVLSTKESVFFMTIPAGEYGVVEALFTTTDGKAMTARFNGGTVKAGVVREFKTIDFIHNTNVFLIYDEATLLEFAAKVAAGEFDYDVARVTASFAVSAETAAAWTPIEGFAGLLEGSDKVISGMQKPLFGTVTGHLRNVHLNSAYTVAPGETFGALAVTAGAGALIEMCEMTKDATISVAGTTEGTTLVGGVIATAEMGSELKGVVNNASITVTVNNSAAIVNVGGVLGHGFGNITNCKNTGAISAVGATLDDFHAGGLIAQMGTTSGKTYLITGCENTGDLLFDKSSTATLVYMGGVICLETKPTATTDLSMVEQTTNLGKLTFSGTIPTGGEGLLLGGVVARGYEHHFNCYNGKEGDTSLGAILANGTCENATTNMFIGGVAAWIDSSPSADIYYSENWASVTYDSMVTLDTQYAAGVVSYKSNSDDQGDIRYCTNHGPITGTCTSGTNMNIAGIVCHCNCKNVGCINNGDITLNIQSANAFYACGVASVQKGQRIYDATNNGNIVVNGIGQQEMFDNNGYIGGCYGEGTQSIVRSKNTNGGLNNGNITVKNLIGADGGKVFLGGVAAYIGSGATNQYLTNTGNILAQNCTFLETFVVGGTVAQTTSPLAGKAGVLDGSDPYVSNSGNITLKKVSVTGNLYVAGVLCYEEDTDRFTGLKNTGRILIDSECSIIGGGYIGGIFGSMRASLAEDPTDLNNNLVNMGDIFFNGSSTGRVQIGGIVAFMTEELLTATDTKAAAFGRGILDARNEGNINVGIDPETGNDCTTEQALASYLYVAGISAQHQQTKSGNLYNYGNITIGSKMNQTGSQCYVAGICPYINKAISAGKIVENHGDITFRGTTAATYANFAGCTGRTVTSRHSAAFTNTGDLNIAGKQTGTSAEAGVCVGGCIAYSTVGYGDVAHTNSGKVSVSMESTLPTYVGGVVGYNGRSKSSSSTIQSHSNSGAVSYTGKCASDVFVGGIIGAGNGNASSYKTVKYFVKNSSNTGAVIAAKPTCVNLFVGSIGGWVDGADDGSNTATDDVRAITDDNVTGIVYYDGDAGKLYGLNAEYTDADGNIALPGVPATSW